MVDNMYDDGTDDAPAASLLAGRPQAPVNFFPDSATAPGGGGGFTTAIKGEDPVTTPPSDDWKQMMLDGVALSSARDGAKAKTKAEAENPRVETPREASFRGSAMHGLMVTNPLAYADTLDHIGDMQGDPKLHQWADELRRAVTEDKSAYDPIYESFGQAWKNGDLWGYAKETAGEQLGVMGPMIAGSALGGYVGAQAGSPFGKFGAKVGGVMGAMGGAAITSAPLQISEMRQALKREGVEGEKLVEFTNMGAVVLVSLDSAFPALQAMKIGGFAHKALAGKVAQKLSENLAKGGTVRTAAEFVKLWGKDLVADTLKYEVTTELAQEAVTALGAKMMAGKDVTAADAAKFATETAPEVIIRTIIGAGFMGSLGSGMKARRDISELKKSEAFPGDLQQPNSSAKVDKENPDEVPPLPRDGTPAVDTLAAQETQDHQNVAIPPAPSPGGKGVGVLQFIRDKGGLTPSGELDTLDAGRYPGLINKAGLSADQMREQLVEAGYLEESGPDQPAITTPQDVYDLVARATGGERIVPLREQGADDDYHAAVSSREEAKEMAHAEKLFVLPVLEQYTEELGDPFLEQAYKKLSNEDRLDLIDQVRKGADPADVIEMIAMRDVDVETIQAMVLKRGPDPVLIDRIRSLLAQQQPDLLAGFDEMIAAAPVRQKRLSGLEALKLADNEHPGSRDAHQLMTLTKAELAGLAGRRGITVKSKWNKGDIVEALRQNATASTTESVAERPAIDSAIAGAYRKLRTRNPNESWIYLEDLRAEMKGHSREEVDTALRRLWREGAEKERRAIDLTIQEDQGRLTPGQRAAATNFGASRQDLISIEPDSPIFTGGATPAFNAMMDSATAFTENVNAIATELGSPASDMRVPIAEIYDAYAKKHRDAGTLEAFKARLVEVAKSDPDRRLSLGRLDLPERMEKSLRERSAVKWGMDDVHFVEAPDALDATAALASTSNDSATVSPGQLPELPALPVKRSVHPAYIASLIDGSKHIDLQPHLEASGVTVQQYAEHFNLAPDYPMVSPNETARRYASIKNPTESHDDYAHRYTVEGIAMANEPAAGTGDVEKVAAPAEVVPAVTPDIGAQLAKLIVGTTPRAQWASTLGVTEAELRPHVERALTIGILRRDSRGTIRRTAFAHDNRGFVIGRQMQAAILDKGLFDAGLALLDAMPEAEMKRAAQTILGKRFKDNAVNRAKLIEARDLAALNASMDDASGGPQAMILPGPIGGEQVTLTPAAVGKVEQLQAVADQAVAGILPRDVRTLVKQNIDLGRARREDELFALRSAPESDMISEGTDGEADELSRDSKGAGKARGSANQSGGSRSADAAGESGAAAGSARILRQESGTLRADGSIIAGRISRAAGPVADSARDAAPLQQIGTTEAISVPGYAGFVTAANVQPHAELDRRGAPASEYRLATVTYRLYPEGTTLDDPRQQPLDVFGKPLIFMRISQHMDGTWETSMVQKSVKDKGIASKLYNAIEKDMGIRLSPSGLLSQEGLAYWKKRSPDSVKWHAWAPSEGHYISPRRLIDTISQLGLELAANKRITDRNPQLEMIYRDALAERGDLLKKWLKLPPEARAAADTMFSLRDRTDEIEIQPQWDDYATYEARRDPETGLRMNKAGLLQKLPFYDRWGDPVFDDEARENAISALGDIAKIDVVRAPWATLKQALTDLNQIVAQVYYYEPKRSLDDIKKNEWETRLYRNYITGRMDEFLVRPGAIQTLFDPAALDVLPPHLRPLLVPLQAAAAHFGEAVGKRAGLGELMDWPSTPEPRTRSRGEALAKADITEKRGGFYFESARQLAKIPDTIFTQGGQAVINSLLQSGVKKAEIEHFQLQDLAAQKPATRAEFERKIAESRFEFRRRSAFFNAERSDGNNYGVDETTRAHRGPRVPGRGIYFERLMAFPKRLKGGDEFAPGFFSSPHWGGQLEGTWASWRGSTREVAGYGKTVLGEEGQTDYMQGASALDRDGNIRRPRIKAKDYLSLGKDRGKYLEVTNHARDMIMRAGELAGMERDQTRSFLRTLIDELPADRATWMDRLDALRQAVNVERGPSANDIATAVSMVDAVAGLRAANEAFFAPGARDRYLAHESNFTPESPLDDSYTRTMVRDLLLAAVQQNASAVAISTSDTSARVQNNDKAAHFYDGQLVPSMQKELRRLTGDGSLVMKKVALEKPLGGGKLKPYTVWIAKLSPELRKRIKDEGLPVFALRNGRQISELDAQLDAIYDDESNWTSAEAAKVAAARIAEIGAKQDELRMEAEDALRKAPRKPYDPTATEAFKTWFKESKVVDATGKPVVSYHGTVNGDFDQFDTYGSKYGLFGQGGYFTEDAAIASQYTGKGLLRAQRAGTEARTVYPVYLSIQNPIDMEAPADAAAWAKAFGEFIYENNVAGLTNEEAYRTVEDFIADERYPAYEGAEIMQDGLRAMGYDGITHLGGGRVDPNGPRHRVWIAFDPEQIKSIFNEGSFDASNPNMSLAARETGSGLEALGKTDPWAQQISLGAQAIENEARRTGKSASRITVETARHEALEFFKALGIIAPGEWQILTNAASSLGWVKETGVREAYTKRFAAEMSKAELEELIRKEAIATKFGEYRAGDYVPDGVVAKIFKRISDYLDKLMNGLKGLGFNTWEEIFQKINAGEMKARYEQIYGTGEQETSELEAGIAEAMEGKQAIIHAGTMADARGLNPTVGAPVVRQPVPGVSATASAVNTAIDVAGRAKNTLAGNAQATPALPGLTESINNLKHALGLSVRPKRLDPRLAQAAGRARAAGNPNAQLLGQYEGVARIKHATDIEAVTHEAGHHVQRLIGRPLNALLTRHMREIVPLAGGVATGNALNEGFAEFFRRYVNNPAAAQQRAPRFYHDFEQLLEAHDPLMFERLEHLQNAIEQYIIGDPVEQGIANQTVLKTPKNAFTRYMADAERDGYYDTTADRLHSMYQAMISQNHGWWLAGRELLREIERRGGGRISLAAVNNSFKLLRMTTHTAAWAQQDLKAGVALQSRPNGGGVSMHQVLARAFGSTEKRAWNERAAQEFGEYLIARRAIHQYVRYRPALRAVVQQFVAANPAIAFMLRRLPQNAISEIDNPPTKESLQHQLMKLNLLEQRMPQFRAAAELYYQFNKDILTFLHEKHLLPTEEYNRLSQDTDYAPFQRNMDDIEYAEGGNPSARRPGRGRDQINKNAVYKAFEGSMRDIINPIQSTVQFVYEMKLRAAVNDSIRAMDRTARQAGPAGNVILERLPPMEASRVRVSIRDALRTAGKEAGMSPQDITHMLGNVENQLGQDVITHLFTQTKTREKGERIIWFFENGEPVPCQLPDGELGRLMFEGLTAIGQRNSALLTDILGGVSHTVRAGVTISFGFIFRNIFVDGISAWVNSPFANPYTTQVAGMREILTGGQYQRLYNRYAGMMGGEATQMISEASINRDIEQMRRTGFAIRRPEGIRDLAKMAFQLGEFSETATRVGIFRNAMRSAMADGMSEQDAAVEAAHYAHDVYDFSQHGSKTEAFRRMIPFWNAAMIGVDKYTKTLLGANDRGIAPNPFGMGTFLAHRLGYQLSRNEQRAMGQSAKAWLLTTLVFGGASLIFAGLGADDDDLKEVPDSIRATHWIMSLNGVLHFLPKSFQSFMGYDPEAKKKTDTLIRLPKPFEMAWFANLVERSLDGAVRGDPTAARGFISDFWSTVTPPDSIPGLDIAYGFISGKDFYSGNDIIPFYEKGLERADQSGPYTTETARRIGRAINMSPYYVDFLVRGLGTSTAGDVTTLADYASGRGPRPSIADFPVARRFTYNVARNSQSLGKFYDMVHDKESLNAWFWDAASSDARSFTAAAESYEKRAKVSKASADDFYERLNPDQKVYATLSVDFKNRNAKLRNLHPMLNAKEGVTETNNLMKEVVDGTLLINKGEKDQERKPLDREQMRFARNEIGHIRKGIAQNAMHIIGVEGWANRPMVDVDKRLDTLKAVAPEVHEELMRRLGKKGFQDAKELVKSWPETKARVLAQREEADLGDLLETPVGK